MKILKVFGVALASTLMLLFGAAVITSSLTPDTGADSKSLTQKSSQTSYVDPDLLPLVSKLGIDTRGLTIRYVDSLQKKETGNFDGEHTISLVRGGGKTQTTDTVLAHEYLHYKWSLYSQTDKETQASELENLYSSDSQMKVRMQPYIDNEHLDVGSLEFSNELHSVYCTESSDKYLSRPVLNECNRWINRSALTFLR
jgi:hypothetical protein